MMTQMINQSNSKYNDQAKLKILCQKILYRIEDLLNLLNLELSHNAKHIYGCCPIHGGDNPNALKLMYDPTGKGYWTCFTHHCEKRFMSSIIGFVRGVLSHNKYNWTQQGDKLVSFDDTIQFLLNFLDDNYDKIEINLQEINKQKFVSQINGVYYTKPSLNGHTITREQIRKALIIPAEYYIKRGYSKEILNNYDVGLCKTSDKSMYGRIVVPVYDNSHKFMVGCTGRSIYEKCNKCGTYHDPYQQCPTKDKLLYHPKWKHSKGFLTQNYLYNYWKAKSHIKEMGLAILVESAGNVWRLEEAVIKKVMEGK